MAATHIIFYQIVRGMNDSNGNPNRLVEFLDYDGTLVHGVGFMVRTGWVNLGYEGESAAVVRKYAEELGLATDRTGLVEVPRRDGLGRKEFNDYVKWLKGVRHLKTTGYRA